MREYWEGLLTFFRIEARGGAYLALAFAAALYWAGTRIAARGGNADAECEGAREGDAGAECDGAREGNADAECDGAPQTKEFPAEETALPGAVTGDGRSGGSGGNFLALAVWLVLLLNPLTALLFEKITGRVYRYVYAALAVPVLPLIAYAAADILKRRKRRTLPAALLLVVSLACAGTVVPYGESDAVKRRSAEWDEEEAGAMETVLSQAAQMRENGQVPLMAAPKHMMDAVRRYDAGIMLVYGRDLWQTDALAGVNDIYTGEQVLLCQAMEAEPPLTVPTAELALTYGCNLIVLKEPLEAEFLDDWGLSCVYESGRFFVYTR
ncbi:MAG: hypothetical protein NC254_03105 [bacterium]|nr:hypothetical protein [bacterium]